MFCEQGRPKEQAAQSAGKQQPLQEHTAPSESDEGSSNGGAEAADEQGKGPEVLERCDSAYLPRVQPLADMRPINDTTSRALSLQACPAACLPTLHLLFQSHPL